MRGTTFSRFDAAVFAISTVLVIAIIGVTLASETRQVTHEPTIAYLHPAYGTEPEQIWIAPIANPGAAERITSEEAGIYNFAVSEDGKYIAYAARNPEERFSDIFLMNLQTRQVEQLTFCAMQKADCKTPTFQPGQQVIAYERTNTNLDLENVGVGATRIWLLDYSRKPFATRPLSDNSQYIGYAPMWSDKGDAIAFYSSDIAQMGMLLYEFGVNIEEAVKYIPNNTGTMGSISPDGRRVILPEMTQMDSNEEQVIYRSYLRIADLNMLEFEPLIAPDLAYDDISGLWHPDGVRVLITRRYATTEQSTPGYHYYVYNTETKALETLVFDVNQTHNYVEWNSTGDKLLYQRLRLFNDDGTPTIRPEPEVMVYDLESQQNIIISTNAFNPRQVFP